MGGTYGGQKPENSARTESWMKACLLHKIHIKMVMKKNEFTDFLLKSYKMSPNKTERSV